MVRLANNMMTFWAGTRASLKVSLRLQAVFLLVCLVTLMLWPGLSFAVPPGTVVNNTAQVSLDINSAHFILLTNTDQFTVEAPLPPDQGDLAASGHETINFYPGSSGTLDITIENTGGNDLKNGFLIIDTPLDSSLILSGSDVTLVSKTTVTVGSDSTPASTSTSTQTKTRRTFTVSDLATATSKTYQAELTLSVNTDQNDNVVSFEYQANDADIDNEDVSLNINPRTKGTLQLMHYSTADNAVSTSIMNTEYQNIDGDFHALPAPTLEQTPGVKVTDSPLPLIDSLKFSHNQVIFIRLEDQDQNIDQSSAETIEITLSITEDGEQETLRLIENGNNSGVFTGYLMLNVQAAESHNGMLEVHPDTEVDFTYTDQVDNSDSSLQIALVDPYGVIFDSATGEYLNDYTVHFINVDTGQPATVFGDDGVSSFPSTVVTGGTVTDSGGNIYDFSDGAYRFPFAPAGNYKLVVVPPADALYRWPSTKSLELISQLPNAPFSITLGSRGEEFPLIAGPPLHIDVPVDALNTQMYVQRSADKGKVGPGDFIQYRVSLENVATATIHDVLLTDSLPQGFRFEPKSLLIDGLPATVSGISDNGRELTFNLGSMDSGDTHIIEYVAAVGAVNRGMRMSSSHAIANSGAATSNVAEHEVQVLDELMRSRALLLGQVLTEPRDENDTEPRRGIEGVRIFLEDGKYAITDERGMYHFEDIRPGSHVVQLDLETLPGNYELILKQDNTRFAGNAWSQFVDIQGGTLWRTDFNVALKGVPEGVVSIQIGNQRQRDNSSIPFTIDISNNDVQLNNMRLNVLIPEGAKYIPGSGILDDKEYIDPTVNDNMLSYRLGDGNIKKPHNQLRFRIYPPALNSDSELITKAFLLFDTPVKRNQRTPVADHSLITKRDIGAKLIQNTLVLSVSFDTSEYVISDEDKNRIRRFAEQISDPDNMRIHAVGHSDNLHVKPNVSAKGYSDNYQLSAHRARVIAKELRDVLELKPSQLTVEGRGHDEPIADNDTEADRAANRRVELIIYSLDKPGAYAAQVVARQGKRQVIKTKLNDPSEPINKTSGNHKAGQSETIYDASWLKGKDANIEWLLPEVNGLPKQTSTPITIKHHKTQKVDVLLNGEPVHRVNYEGSIKNKHDAMLSLWKGIDLEIGDNELEAIIKDGEGNVVEQIKRSVHVSGAATYAELLIDKSTLIADGRTTPVIALKITDKDGYPLRKGMSGQFSISPPYEAARNSELNLEVMPGIATQIKQTFTVGADGIALIELEPTNKTGEAEFKLIRQDESTQVINARIKAEQRDWILVGLAEGTAGYNTLSGQTETLEGSAAEDHLYQDGRIAFYAKGQVLGKWLLTMAYDTDKQRVSGEDPNLFQTIDPGTYYTVYGDSGSNGNDAPSTEKLYLKLERDEFYLLFGDYTTDFNETELAVYDRTLTGIKSELVTEKYEVALFTSQTNQSFIKDEFRGEGRSGPYELSRNNIAMNSEKVIVQVRDRFRSEVIVETLEFNRHIDYDINYRTGTITFRKPVFSVDQNLNHIFIIVKYEAYDDADDRATYGVRAKANINDKMSIGITHVNEGRTGGKAQLGGVDADYQITDATSLHLEAARTIDSKDTGTNADGNAYVAELKHQTDTSDTTAYVRETDTGFGLGQTNGSEDSTRKIGAETSVAASEKINVRGQAYRIEQTATNATRDLAEAGAEMNLDSASLNLGLRTVMDERGNGTKQQSDQLTAGASKGFIDNRLVARIDREQNIRSKGDNSIDFPNSTRIGADMRVNEKVTLFAEQELTDGDVRDTRHTLMGLRSTPWTGATLYTGVTNSASAEGESTSANIAGNQTWQLTERWSIDIGAEESRLLSAKPGIPFNPNVPYARGNFESFTAASLGLTYMAGDWMWAGRFENRNGDIEDSHTISTSVQTTPNASISTLVSLQYLDSIQTTGAKHNRTDLGLGIAYRPSGSRWIFLDKLELKWDETSGTVFESEEQRIINMFNANYKIQRWQLSLQYAAKTVTETIQSQTYNSFTDLSGFETRYDITKKWDVGLHGNILRAKQAGNYDYRSGVSVGHSVAKNIWISLGYNFVGVRDKDFSTSYYTSEGVFLRFRMKFDQASVRDAVKWAGQ